MTRKETKKVDTTIRMPIGYRYCIIENGYKICGEIISDDGQVYEVRWDDGQITIEDNIDPAI